MSVPISRANELTGVANRSLFEEPPGDVVSTKDLARWVKFRKAYTDAMEMNVAPFPLQLDFGLISTCNMKCSFCTHGHQRVEKITIDPVLFKKAIDEGEEHGLVSVKLNSINEPLLAPNWEVFVRYAKQHGVLNVYFATNGLLLTERNIDHAITERVSKIMISLDATTEDTFYKMRKSRAFKQIESNIIRLIKRREQLGVSWPLVRVNFLKTHVNVHEIEDFFERWNGVADMIGFQDQLGLPDVDGDLFKDDRYVADQSSFSCSFPFKLLRIDASGEIYPCCAFSGRKMPLGNIEDMTVLQAWTCTRIQLLRTVHKDKNWREFNPVCRKCITGA